MTVKADLAARAAQLLADEEAERARTLDPEAFSAAAVSKHSTTMEERIRGNRFYSQKSSDVSGFLKK